MQKKYGIALRIALFASLLTALLTTLLTALLVSRVAQSALNLDLPSLNLPEMGGAGATISQDQNLGLKVLRTYRRRLPVVEDPELNSWIRSLGNKLASKAPNAGKLYFLLVNNPNVNAYASLGGVIVINTGLVLQTESESELAGVLAHEIAHVTQNHLARRSTKSKGKVLATGAAILAGLAAGSQSSDAGSAIITTAIATQQHNLLAFSRDMEAEADRVGIRILSSSGFKASGMPDFMATLDRLNDSSNAQLTKYLLSHPLSIERLSDTRSRAQRLGNRGTNHIGYFYAREKIRGLMSSGLHSQTPPLPNASLNDYAQGIKHSARGQHGVTLQKLGISNRHLPEALAIAEALNATRQYQKTIALLAPLAKTRPGEQSILVPLSNALLGVGKIETAWQYLRYVVPTEQTSLAFFEVKQEVAKRNGYIADAYLAAAERNVRIGEYQHAVAQLKQAITLPRISGHDSARLKSKLSSIEKNKH